MDKNLTAQEALLVATGSANATFRQLFDLTGWRQACEAAASGVREVGAGWLSVGGLVRLEQ